MRVQDGRISEKEKGSSQDFGSLHLYETDW